MEQRRLCLSLVMELGARFGVSKVKTVPPGVKADAI